MPTSNSTDLVIKDFRLGIGPSPHLGFGDMRNVDISTKPGIVRANYASVLSSATAIQGNVTQIISNIRDRTEYFSIDENGSLYQSNDSCATWHTVTGYSATANGGGLGIQIWEDYLFYARPAGLDLYGPLTNGPSANWYNAWNSIGSDNLYHPMLWSKNDNKLYGGASFHIFSVEKTSSAIDFSPTGGATSYTFTQEALDLPGSSSDIGSYRVKCLEELGNNLMIGTSLVTRSLNDIKKQNDGLIFPWDRSAVSFGQPLSLDKQEINQMKVIDSVLYVNAGRDSIWYKSNGVQVTPVATLPDGIVNLDSGRYLANSPNAIAFHMNRLFFGVTPGATASSDAAVDGVGVWSVNPTTGVLVFEHAISTGNMGSTSNVKIGSILPFTKDRLLIGWKDGATAGIDLTGTGRYDGYESYMDTAYYQVGTTLNKREFTQLEFQLVKPLATGQGVKISYRTDLSASFTVIGTYDFSTLGAVSSHNAVADIPACEFVQLRIALTCAGTSASPELRIVTLR